MIRDLFLTPPQIKKLARDNWKLRRVNLGMAIASLLFVGISAACTSADAGWTDMQRDTVIAEAITEGFTSTQANCIVSWTEDRYTFSEVANDKLTLEDGLTIIDVCGLS